MIPRDDLIAHEADGCPCGPARIPVVGGDGTRSEIVKHRRLDGTDPRPMVDPGDGWVPDSLAEL